MREEEIAKRKTGHLNADGTAKKSYDTKAAAKAGIKSPGAKNVGKLEPYRCRWCNGWHIGHRRYTNGD
jgi:hypothetical protein